MTLTVKVEPIDKDIEVIIREDLSPEARSKALANFARGELKEGQDINRQALGRVPTHDTFVDGVQRSNEDQVRPDGTIFYEFDLLSDLFVWIADQLERHSPVLRGTYKKSHIFFADGAESDPANPPQASEYIFLNVTPYSRKIEGDLKRKPLSPQAPDGVYEVVAALARRKYSGGAKISFTYRAPLGGAIFRWAQTPSARRLARTAGRGHAGSTAEQHTEWLTRTPAISITSK